MGANRIRAIPLNRLLLVALAIALIGHVCAVAEAATEHREDVIHAASCELVVGSFDLGVLPAPVDRGLVVALVPIGALFAAPSPDAVATGPPRFLLHASLLI